MKLISTLAFTLTTLASATAMAATTPNLEVTLTAPAGIHVNQSGTYSVRVKNRGNRNASGVVLTIALPRTHTSPTVHILGNLGARDSRCSLAGTNLTCALNTVARFGAYTDVAFALELPYSTAPELITATATTTTQPETNPANNTVTHAAAPALWPTSVTGPATASNQHCTGQALTSYFECALYPSSIAGFTSVLNADHTLSVVGEPTVTGSWSFTGSTLLHVEYLDGGDPVGAIDAYSVGNNCFEGVMLIAPYTIPYEICL